MKLLRELADKDVLKGNDKHAADYLHTPTHAGKKGEPVKLVDAGNGPCWYCSRFVRDEWMRMRRGGETQFSTESQPKREPKTPPNGAPIPPIGERQGDGASSSSSASSESKIKRTERQAARFAEFWTIYPNRKGRKAALAQWNRKGYDAIADRIIADVKARIAGDHDWLRGYVPHGSTYVNGEGWEDSIIPPANGTTAASSAFEVAR